MKAIQEYNIISNIIFSSEVMRMLSKITAIIVAIVSFISSFAVKIPNEGEVFYDLAYGKSSRQIMDVAFPSGYEENRSVILFLHGGGWISGDKSGFTAKVVPMSEKTGCITATMNYRYASGSVDCQDMLDDIDRALKKIRSMAKSRGVNADKVMLVGFSAGGHLALLYSYTRKASAPIEPVAVVSYSGPTDFTSKKFVEKNALSDADYMRSLLSKLTGEKITAMNFDSKKKVLLGCSPVNYVSADCVPTMIVQGAKDKIVYASDTRNFVKKLKASGVTYKYYELPNSGHTLGGDEEAFEKSTKMFAAFIKKFLK